jgi:hypothetical protein
MGKQLRTRPSEVYGVTDEIAAWSFDRAVQTFGNALENRLREIADDAKNKKSAQMKIEREVDKWLNSDLPEGVIPKGRFKDPMSR